MKNFAIIFLSFSLLLIAEHWLLTPPSAFAQSFGAIGASPIAPTVAQCPNGIATFAMLCPVGSGTTFQMYVSYNGGVYAPLVGAAAGVVSFNGRTGNVLPAQNDYAYSQLSAPPTSVAAGTFSVTGASIK